MSWERLYEDEKANWAKVKVPGRMVGGTLLVTSLELKEMVEEWGEYSCTIPSGVIPGKRWMLNVNAYNSTNHTPVWFMCEYKEKDPPDPTQVLIVRTVVEIDPEREREWKAAATEKVLKEKQRGL